MEKMKEELYNELHIVKKDDKLIINDLICWYSNWIMRGYNELKTLVKENYKEFKLYKAIELYNKYKNPIFINGMLIFNSDSDTHKRELYYTEEYDQIDYWIDGTLIFSIKYELVRTIETRYEALYREDETLLW